jgi:hypothetical protein
MINPAEIRAIVERMRSQGRITSADPVKATDKQSLSVQTINRQLTVAKCDQCGMEFVPLNNRNRRCGSACTKRGALMMRRRRGGHEPLGEERTCEQCGARFRQGSILQRHCKPICTRRARSRRERQRLLVESLVMDGERKRECVKPSKRVRKPTKTDVSCLKNE